MDGRDWARGRMKGQGWNMCGRILKYLTGSGGLTDAGLGIRV